MSVGGNHGGQPLLGELYGGAPGLEAVVSGERLRVELAQRAGGQLAPEALSIVEDGVGAALGVGDENTEAAGAQLRRRGVELVVDLLERRFHQQPAAAAGALGQQFELGLPEASDHLVPDLAAADHRQ